MDPNYITLYVCMRRKIEVQEIVIKKFKKQLAMHISSLAAYNHGTAAIYQSTPN
jgi:hypothetical protein